ncbi:palmdelphin-like [Plectropomus leopardus]|uniref:palmdelphin-like n=1 Tax=Plectropomus leopardus TaxID=160734 RepID=UPI001C4CB496|nr:palmdelphin-like [Plectropomus leopardus]
MEEADLLKERLQAITDKRRIQENIAKKRRQIEEEKLKLQYIKKKALREQWLMDGLSQQSEEEQEAMRLQAQDIQQQSDELQSNILRIEEEIETLETQELVISANEEVVLKQLKEVERTAEDIIKEINADFHTDLIHHEPLSLPDIPSLIPLTTKKPPIHELTNEAPKKATFAMEISVEHDKKTGKSQVVSTATITPDTIEERGYKVYDDGHKSVYALHPDGGKLHNGAVGEMTLTEVEELLHQATETNVPTEVQYHQPVYSVPYTGSSRPSTPRTPNKSQTPSPSPFQGSVQSINGAQILRKEKQLSQDLDGWKTPSKTPSPSLIQQDSTSRVQRPREETKLPSLPFPGQTKSEGHLMSQLHFGDKTPPRLSISKVDVSSPNPVALVSVRASTTGMPAPLQPVYRGIDSCSPSLHNHKSDPDALIENSGDLNRHSPFCASLNLVNALPEEVESEQVTMIFMGYENADDEEEEDIQAELVIIGNSDEDDDNDEAQCGESEREHLSYHPEGYKSKVFRPKVGLAKVTGCRNITEDTYTNWKDLGLHKPTFIHKTGKHSHCLQGQRADESANPGS